MNNSWIERKKTNPIFVGDVGVGGDFPISIQSMTNTNTAALEARRYVYDIVLTSPQSVKTRVIEGIIEVTPGVT